MQVYGLEEDITGVQLGNGLIFHLQGLGSLIGTGLCPLLYFTFSPLLVAQESNAGGTKPWDSSFVSATQKKLLAPDLG